MCRRCRLLILLGILAIFTANCDTTALNESRGTLTDPGSEALDRANRPIDSPDGEMVLVPAGEFWMGSEHIPPECKEGCTEEQPFHKIYLDAFWIDRTEVTVASYRRCVEAGPCGPPITSFGSNWGKEGRDEYPVNCMSWFDANTFCEWAGKRLPTEAEWEKAARGTDGRLYPWGNESPTCDFAVALGDEGCNDIQGPPVTRPAGSKPAGASPYGALDMIGNTREWVADWYDETYYANSPAKNPQGPDEGEEKVLRGFNLASPLLLRAASRYEDDPTARMHDGYGFRCANDATKAETGVRLEYAPTGGEVSSPKKEPGQGPS